MSVKNPRGIKIALLIIILTVVAVQPVVAAVTLQTSTNYTGGVNGDSQAIVTTITLSPNQTEIIDAEIRVKNTPNSFVDFGSRERTISSSRAEGPNVSFQEIERINIQGEEIQREGTWKIDQLNADEEITLTLEVYPRTIKSESLEVAQITIEYTQQGQRLEREETVVANLSDSSYFAYQDAQDRISALEEENERLNEESDDDGNIWFYVSIILVAFIGLVAIVYTIYWWY